MADSNKDILKGLLIQLYQELVEDGDFTKAQSIRLGNLTVVHEDGQIFSAVVMDSDSKTKACAMELSKCNARAAKNVALICDDRSTVLLGEGGDKEQLEAIKELIGKLEGDGVQARFIGDHEEIEGETEH